MAKKLVCDVPLCGTKLHAGKEEGDFCYPCASRYERCHECTVVTEKVMGEQPLCVRCLRKLEEAQRKLIRATKPRCEVSARAKNLFK